ncbi:MAG: hypothetical protein LBB61_09580 [Treponema sp.]|jgi:hypothetical protein|nr:hypothetical protein [Treponema sp.]
MNRRFLVWLIACLSAAVPLAAQDFGFGFGDEDAAEEPSGEKSSGVTISGEVSASLLGYMKDFSDGPHTARLGDVFSGALNFSAGNAFGDAVINLKLSSASPQFAFDEAYLRAYIGIFEIEGGLRKLTWGKADSFGPLDVINPLDNTEITDVSDVMAMKIARPLVHAAARFGRFSKLEGVFVPAFEGHRFAMDGRWAPAQIVQVQALLKNGSPPGLTLPDASTLNYAQAGARFTTTLGSSDIGAQYYYGRLPRPAASIRFTPQSPALPSSIEMLYNPYHQIGVDWAQVLFGFNVRAEFAANITDDLGGDDGTVYNPHLAWSFGFDRDLAWGINLNLQVNETITLLHDKITSPLDIEAGSDGTSTRLTGVLSKKFLRDELEVRAAVLWGIEDKDFLILPALAWTRDAVSIEGSVGIFCGEDTGELGQYYDNRFVRLALTYSF